MRQQQCLEQLLQHRQVVTLLGGGQGFFHPVVPRDDNRVEKGYPVSQESHPTIVATAKPEQ